MFALLTITSFGAKSQQQTEHFLPNQFRDFVDHQQRFNVEKPQIERKDGKVIITMSEDRFRMMMRQNAMMRNRRPGLHRPPMICETCRFGQNFPQKFNRPIPGRRLDFQQHNFGKF